MASKQLPVPFLQEGKNQQAADCIVFGPGADVPTLIKSMPALQQPNSPAILSYQWLDDCMSSSTVLPPDNYIIKLPAPADTTKTAGTHP